MVKNSTVRRYFVKFRSSESFAEWGTKVRAARARESEALFLGAGVNKTLAFARSRHRRAWQTSAESTANRVHIAQITIQISSKYHLDRILAVMRCCARAISYRSYISYPANHARKSCLIQISPVLKEESITCRSYTLVLYTYKGVLPTPKNVYNELRISSTRRVKPLQYKHLFH